MQHEEVIIVGAGPCGMAAAIALEEKGVKALLIEKGNIVNSLYRFPTHQTFFSSSDNLEIGDIAFITEKQRPVRNEALTYYREVAKRKDLRIHSYENVIDIKREDEFFLVHTVTDKNVVRQYKSKFVVLATGYYDQPNYMKVPGEQLSKVSHYFKEAHPYYNKDVTVVGGKNSAVDAALELHKAGANVTVLYRGNQYSPSIKPWILPGFDSLVRKEEISMVFNANVKRITEDSVVYQVDGEEKVIDNDFVFAMTGYQPDTEFLNKVGIETDEQTGIPSFNEETYETNQSDIYIAGVVAAGYNNNAIFIENGRFHGEAIATSIASKLSSSVSQ